MQNFSQPIQTVIQDRFSCRIYRDEPISAIQQKQIREYLATVERGPLGTPVRYELVAATPADRSSLNGLGTYGFIQGATGFIVGAMSLHEMNLEDYGYTLEQIILYLTDVGLGTCWLGGTFTKSNFAKKIFVTKEERMPAVVSTGLIGDLAQAKQAVLRQKINADNRLEWEKIFFDHGFEKPLDRENAGDFAVPLEMVRRGPSASNNQPWRMIKDGQSWHFYLQRTKGYIDSFPLKLLRLEDLQRVDIGIAKAHFDLTAKELGLTGNWVVMEPPIKKPDELTEYSITWVPAP